MRALRPSSCYLGAHDLDDDGFSAIVTVAGDRVAVLQATSDLLWESARLDDLEWVWIDPNGELFAHVKSRLLDMDRQGNVRGTVHPRPPKNRIFAGRIINPAGESLYLFRGASDPPPILDADVDGDGNLDVLVPSSNGLTAYNSDGQAILRVRSGDVRIQVGAGNLDGKPGDEVAIAIEHYGVVVLGKN